MSHVSRWRSREGGRGGEVKRWKASTGGSKYFLFLLQKDTPVPGTGDAAVTLLRAQADSFLHEPHRS